MVYIIRVSLSQNLRFGAKFLREIFSYDLPSMGYGVGEQEIGYLYGQLKRIHHHMGQRGKGILWGGLNLFPQSIGHGVVYYANAMLRKRGDTLEVITVPMSCLF